MSVPVGTARTRYIGSGSAGPFAFNFVLYDQTHLKVTKTDTNNTDEELTLTTDYTVSIAADFSSASVTLVVPLAGDGIDDGGSEILTITRDPPIQQLTEWPRNDPFPARTHERAADLAVMMIDRLNEKIGRSLLLPESSSLSGLTLPLPDSEKFLRWNTGGTALENMGISDVGTLIVSPFIETLLDDVDAAGARTTLGALALSAVSAFMLTVLDDADAATARATLGTPYATDSQIRSAAAGAVLQTSGIASAAAPITLNDSGGNIALDWAAGVNYEMLMDGNYTLSNPTNVQQGVYRRLQFTQDGTGGRDLAFGTNYVFPDGLELVLSIDPGAVDVIMLYARTTSIIEAYFAGRNML